MYEGYRVDSTTVSTQKTRKNDYAYHPVKIKGTSVNLAHGGRMR